MHVEVIQELANDDGLCFQHCRWHWDNDVPSEGYRFIWRDDPGNLKPSRGQAWIPWRDYVRSYFKGYER